MTSRLHAVTFDMADAPAIAVFWAGLLGRDVLVESGGALVPGDERQVGLRFVASDTEQVGPRRLHLHLTSNSPEDQQRTVETVLRLGGGHIDVGQAPDDAFVVLADPGGKRALCDRTGQQLPGGHRLPRRGNLRGTRDVGLIWRDALGWPLVWDENQETAIQSPLGGTKVSWGGPPVKPKHGPNRQRFDLVTDDPSTEVERLISLGATRLGDLADGVELADPDGHEFSLQAR